MASRLALGMGPNPSQASSPESPPHQGGVGAISGMKAGVSDHKGSSDEECGRSLPFRPGEAAPRRERGARGNPWVNGPLIAVSLAFILIMLIAPLAVVLVEAFSAGVSVYLDAVSDEYALRALVLTLKAASLAIAVNTLFGLTAAWAVTRYAFKGKSLLITVIDIPFSVSPVIAGLIFILTFGRMSWLHPWLDAFGISIVFDTPGIILATIFVTMPFVARELIPTLEARGTDEEQAAALMGAGFLTIFRRVTLPHIRWALIYGVILCSARALGEFGAVSVVSGRLRGKTNTLPLHVEILYNEYKFTAAFAVASLLATAALFILAARVAVEWRSRRAGGEDSGHVR
ncbi:MAG: sulfate ABC transporter permease subunit CysW [Desulfovibrio sp.]|nr:sulfate ABC transporter permease subunit CysW [Desulfovibrio sp.]